MNVQNEVDQERNALQSIAAVAKRTSCPLFINLIGWGEALPDPCWFVRNPGVMFESPRRIVVFQEIVGELRYYAGGWRSHQSQIYAEQDRIAAEGSELGVFETVRDAMTYAEQYLVQEKDFQAIDVPRQVRYGRSAGPETSRQI